MATDSKQTADTKKMYIVVCVSFVIMLLFGQLPPFGSVTPYGMQLLGIFLGCIFGWIFGYVIPIAMLAILMTGLTVAGQTVDTMIIASQGAQMVFLIFWAFLFVYALQSCGLMDYLCNKLLSLKWCVKSPWHIAMSIWFTTCIVGGICSQPFAVMIVMLSIFYELTKKIGAAPKSSFVGFVIVFTAAFSAIAVGMVPYSGTLLFAMSLMSTAQPGIEYNIPLICVVNIITTFGMLFFAGVLLKILLSTGRIKVDFTLDNLDRIVDKEAVADKKLKVAVFYILLVAFVMILPLLLPAGEFKTFVNRFGTAGIFFAVCLLMCFTKFDGKPMLDVPKALNGGAIYWDVYFMMGSALAIAGLLVTPEAGLSATIMAALNAVLGGFSPYVLAVAIVFAGLVITNCVTNVVAMNMVIPIMTIMFASLGINPAFLVGILGIVLDHGLVLPSGSPLAAYLHGNKDWVTSGQVYGFTIMSSLTLAASFALIGVPIALSLV